MHVFVSLDSAIVASNETRSRVLPIAQAGSTSTPRSDASCSRLDEGEQVSHGSFFACFACCTRCALLFCTIPPSWRRMRRDRVCFRLHRLAVHPLHAVMHHVRKLSRCAMDHFLPSLHAARDARFRFARFRHSVLNETRSRVLFDCTDCEYIYCVRRCIVFATGFT